jgi:hypothetical protein
VPFEAGFGLGRQAPVAGPHPAPAGFVRAVGVRVSEKLRLKLAQLPLDAALA